MQLPINNWATTLVEPAPAASLEMTVAAPEAARLGTIPGGHYYAATLAKVVEGIEVAWEIVRITATSSGVLTVQRGQEGTDALDWLVGESISIRVTAALIEELRGGSEPPAPAPAGRFGPPRPAVGQYLSAQVASGTVAGQQYFQASARLVPFEVSASMTVDQLLGHVTTSSAGREIRLAVYSSDANGWPAERLRQTAALSAATAGAIPSDITPLELEPGQLYWLALQANGSFFVMCMTAGGLLAQPTASDTAAQCISRLTTFADGLPSSWAFNASELSSLPAPYVLARRSA